MWRSRKRLGCMAAKSHELERPCVLVDQRERIPLSFGPDFDVEHVLLPVGDYSLRGSSSTVAIERKRNGELQSCCGTDRERFIAQIERMREYPVRWLVIESDMDEITLGLNRSAINPLSVLGTLIKFGSDWNIPVMLCGDARNTSLFVERILLREWKRQQEKLKAERKAG